MEKFPCPSVWAEPTWAPRVPLALTAKAMTVAPETGPLMAVPLTAPLPEEVVLVLPSPPPPPQPASRREATPKNPIHLQEKIFFRLI
jgi:hypothetical protein